MKVTDIFGGITVGIALTSVGFIFLFRREKIVEALVASNKVFWEKMNYSPKEEGSSIITRIMIPFMGVVFIAGGIASVVKAVMSLLGA